MKYANYIGALTAALVIMSCFSTWVTIPEAGLTVSGFQSAGTNFGKPGLMNTVMSSVALELFLVPKVWAKRTNLFFAGFNMAWAVRNFILITACRAGDCPVKANGIYILLFGSILMQLMAVFPDLKLKQEDSSSPKQ
ncbi:hypothetical protein KJS94_04155 [Flavihumibacter rivuli]|uniref:hypothetical protein n=1 Tax=Flavihumibacter rivuli TaxID=2838156 RepID=UPI001BDEBF05|nr:hypothetical protein [Flavihumibacter rivuli]ULQ57393.1 hypothetical protein KJS94_04155 [Flavihumibacter rivuli]